MTYDFQTSKEFCGSQNSEISRRHLLQLMGYSSNGYSRNQYFRSLWRS